MSDIENIFISPIRSYKSGKQFTLRCHVESAKSSLINPNNMKIMTIVQGLALVLFLVLLIN